MNRSFKHINSEVYVPLQGPSELGASGKLVEWDRSADLGRIAKPTLVIGACYDTMDPAHMEWMASAVQQGCYLYCPNGSHMALYDDQQNYFRGLIRFIQDVDAGRFPYAKALHTLAGSILTIRAGLPLTGEAGNLAETLFGAEGAPVAA